MTSSPASNNPRTPQPTSTTPKPLRFAFPFRDAKGKTIIDEHLFHAWLMNEPGGNFAASPSGLWHGGIHVSADGAGPMLDLKHGVRCLADGEVIAYRLDRISPTSRIPASEGQPELNVPYSTSFALVRHTLEYPAGNRLSFFSLYMHLQGFADYECEPSQPRPGYWSTQVEVTSYAQDRPHPASQGQPSAPDRAGLRVRASKQHGTILCILPHGARATIGRRDGDWGQVSAVEGPSPYPPQDGRFVGPYEAVGGWIFMGSEPGDPVVREVMPDSAFDRVVIPPHPVKVGAGDLIGYLGPYWHTADPAQPNRIVHIEVFCDGTLPAYIEASRAAAKADYHSERPILRIDRSVKLYAGPSVRQEGANAPRTAIVQVYSQCVLDALPADCKGSVDDDPFNHGKGEPWWKITSADSRYADITGWVRNRQTPAGRVTRESPGHWIDFEMFTDSDANNPTLFGSADAWLDYVLDAGKPDLSDVGKLKPLATGVYRAMSPARNEKEAADELLSHGANRWLRFRASRLIPRHRSEWASEESYRELFAQLVTRSEPSPYHAAEIERISKLAWWDEVQGKVSQPFPSSPDVFHIHPIGLIGNFFKGWRQAQGNGRFPSDVIEAAQEAQAKWGIPASVSLAQWAFESGYGKHMPADSNNPFGIKANSQDIANGNFVNAMATEVVHGQRIHIPQPFRKFSSIADAFDYHGRLLATGRAYTHARSMLPNPYGFANGLTGHYATEPNYGQKLIDGYINPNNLTQYDNF
ncbi:glucosaminidase domain-containing protein [Paraburkholderia sp. BL10I2N1]|uniref:glycoside hydrolase family 73 protein n=1 Tax=Paraburkholderia sp. BL10I2N1 TaxID=1938796 RepID=UPI00105D0D77|nr:glucosaminidase domain-containing protein [Paraburkholderia sp. BL10I2N1]TDN69505.1 flagellum-specific peptidoglycan hydrolase FlgJ [Paraburkholderia sp. BL10I2N1]